MAQAKEIEGPSDTQKGTFIDADRIVIEESFNISNLSADTCARSIKMTIYHDSTDTDV